MAIQVYKRPTDKCFSGNPIHYQLFSAAAFADSTIYYETKIYFKRTDAAAYSATPVFRYNPVGGIADVDIQDVLDSLLEYEVPSIPDDFEYASPLFCRKMTGLFYLAFRQISTAIPDPAWTTSESDHACFVIKGGLSFEKWRGDNFWVNYFEPLKPFLTWQTDDEDREPRGRLASLNERMYLAFLNLNELDPFSLKMRRKVTFIDGTVYSYDHNFPANNYEVVYFPVGAKQLKLDEVYPSKKIWYWTLQVWNVTDNLPLSEEYKYELDNRNDYNEITLNYRNSIGGLDSVRIRGVIEYNVTREFSQQLQIVAHDYFTGAFINGKVKAVSSTEYLLYKGEVGFVSKEEQDRLRDFHLQREVWWEQKLKWLPVIALTGSQKLKSTEDKRWSMSIDFAIASDGDRFYTPAKVDLQDGTLPSIILCTAVISDLAYEFIDPNYHITWNLVSGAPNKYFVSTPGISGGAPHETLTTDYTFDWLPVGDNVIKVQPLCLINGTLYPGTPQYITITVAPACTPVAFSGSPALPNATQGVLYNYTMSLTGTAPFALANVFKPSWMTINIVGSDIVFGGTPPVTGGIDSLESVSFDITNCGGNNFVSFAQDITVVAPGHNFKVINMISGWTIVDVPTAFYTIVSGAFPMLPGAAIIGDHIAYNGVITVSVSNAGGIPCNLKIYVNGSLQETLAVTASINYHFATHNYLAGDTIEIRLIS